MDESLIERAEVVAPLLAVNDIHDARLRIERLIQELSFAPVFRSVP